MEKYVLDRIEGSFAVMEDENGKIINVSIKRIKGRLKESGIYSKDKEYFIFNEKYTNMKEEKINYIMQHMWK